MANPNPLNLLKALLRHPAASQQLEDNVLYMPPETFTPPDYQFSTGDLKLQHPPEQVASNAAGLEDNVLYMPPEEIPPAKPDFQFSAPDLKLEAPTDHARQLALLQSLGAAFRASKPAK